MKVKFYMTNEAMRVSMDLLVAGETAAFAASVMTAEAVRTDLAFEGDDDDDDKESRKLRVVVAAA